MAVAGVCALSALLASPTPARADPGIRYVALSGSDAGNDCTNSATPCRTIQYAVDQAVPGDEIRVATGVYTDLVYRAGHTQTVYIYVNGSLTIRGGYTTADWTHSDPDAHPTVLNPQGQGRAIYVGGNAPFTVTLEGLWLVNGRADGPNSEDQLGGGAALFGGVGPSYFVVSGCRILSNTAASDGGGLYATSKGTLVLRDSTFYSNTAGEEGGGFWIGLGPTAALTLTGNVVYENSAQSGGGGSVRGGRHVAILDNEVYSNTAIASGGLFVGYGEDVDLEGNRIHHNEATIFEGGGLALEHIVSGTLRANTVQENNARYGGGLYAYSATVTLTDNAFLTNTASQYGGAIRGYYSATLSLISNTFSGNTAYRGGAILLDQSDNAYFRENRFSFNSSTDDGGAVFLWSSRWAVLRDNVFHDNTAGTSSSSGSGGAVFLYYADGATLEGNEVYSNTAGLGAGGSGGGIEVSQTPTVTLKGNSIHHNHARWGGGGIDLNGNVHGSQLLENEIFLNRSDGSGGGVAWANSLSPTLEGNRIFSNTSGEYGAGVYLYGADGAWIEGNQVFGNEANGDGGGLALTGSDPVTVVNNMVWENRTARDGAGIFLGDASAHLLHNTLARNGGGGGQGVYVVWSARAWLTNTIVVSHDVGIQVGSGATATLQATLWGTSMWANTLDWSGPGTLFTGTLNFWGDPAFVDPDGGDYHIGPGSAAIGKGVDAGVATDIDGDRRIGAPDLGADEYRVDAYLPLVIRTYP